MFLVSSDWHCQPDALIPQARELIGKADPSKDTLIGVGDLFDFLPLGKDAFRSSKAIDDFVEALGGQTFHYVAGNHDPYPWVRKRFKDYANIKVYRILNWDDKWYFRHGHRWADDWRYLRYVAPALVEFMAEHCPRLWHWFSRRMGWMPSAHREDGAAGSPSERHKYNKAVGKVWRHAIRRAQHNDVALMIGHTHCSGILRRAMDGDVKVVMADDGTLKDGTYVTIDDDIKLCTLP